jgi:ankyrin repeat protein
VNDPGADASEIAYQRRCEVLYPIHLAMGLPDTPFGEAFQPGNIQTVRYLLDAGADPNQSTQIRQFRNMNRILVPGLTPLLMAMQPAVPVETVTMLLERGASPTKIGSYNGWFFPKRRNIRRECWDRSPLGAALLGSATNDSFPLNMDKIRLLLAYGGAHENSYITAWRIPSYPMPVMYRHWDHPKAVEVLQLFIAHGADIADWADRLVPPTLSVIWWAETAIALCLATGVPHKVWAVTEKVCKVITLLAEATLDENYVGPTRKSTIMDATVAVSSECRRIPQSKKGQTALRYMCRSIDFGGSPQIIRLLLEYGADMNSRDARGRTPLHYASMFSSGDRVRELVQFLGGPAGSGLAVNAADARGWTPLHYACLFGLWDDLEGQVATARLLVESGADVSTRTNNRWTPLSLAALTANQPLIDLLLDYGAHADDLFLPRKGGSDENGAEAALVPIGRIIFHNTAAYSWPGPCPGLLKMKTKLVARKAGVVTLLGQRLGTEVPLLAVPENTLLPPDLQFEDRFRTPTPRFRVDRMDHPLGITSEAPGDFTSDDFERDIDGVLYLLDSAGLAACVMAPLEPEKMRIFWSGAPRVDDLNAP